MDRRMLNAMLCVISEAGEDGAPAGVMYAALMSQGVTLEWYQHAEAWIVMNGLAEKRWNCLHATPKLRTAYEASVARG